MTTIQDNTNETKEETKEEIKENITSIPTQIDQKVLDKLSNELIALYNYKCKHKINENGSCTFYPTPNCKPEKSKYIGTKYGSKKITMKQILNNQNCSQIEAVSDPNIKVMDEDWNLCSFISGAVTAWSNHHSFRFKVEHIWLLILQAVATHVDYNSEKLRNKWVMHNGQKKLIVHRDNFTLGSSNNDWIGVINEFVQQIDKNTVKDTCELLDCNYSSSSLTDKIATKITVMDICKNYFSYGMQTCCGFPKITLDGTKKDWIKLKAKCEKLLSEKVDKKFGNIWGKSLFPLLDRFIVAFDGNIDGLFWNSMIKRGGRRGSGAYTYYTGWINIFYPNNQEYCVPYSMDLQYVTQGFEDFHDLGFGRKCDEDCKHGGPQDFPIGLSSAPVEWMYLGKKLELKFIAGFVGYLQDDETGEICPNVSWCIAHKMTENELQEKNKNRGWPF